jgi:hypothetical protein
MISSRHDDVPRVPTFGLYCKQAIVSGCFLYSGAAVDVIFFRDTARDLMRCVTRMMEETVVHDMARIAELTREWQREWHR